MTAGEWKSLMCVSALTSQGCALLHGQHPLLPLLPSTAASECMGAAISSNSRVGSSGGSRPTAINLQQVKQQST